MVFGSLGIVFGLSWWSTFTAITVGVALGSLIFAGVAIQSPKTGTNNTLSGGRLFRRAGALPRLVDQSLHRPSVLRDPRVDLRPDNRQRLPPDRRQRLRER